MRFFLVFFTASILALFIAWSLQWRSACLSLPASIQDSKFREVERNNFTLSFPQVEASQMEFSERVEEKSASITNENLKISRQSETFRSQVTTSVNKSSFGLHKAVSGAGRVASDILKSPAPSMQEVSTIGRSSSSLIWEVDEELPLPLVLAESETNQTTPLRNANESIIQQFETNIGLASNSEVEVTIETWMDAKAKADALYKILYGDAAYNQRGIQAAKSVNAN